MPEFRIIIRVDNKAFGENPLKETGRILADLGVAFQHGWDLRMCEGSEISDSNKDICGFVGYHEEDED